MTDTLPDTAWNRTAVHDTAPVRPVHPTYVRRSAGGERPRDTATRGRARRPSRDARFPRWFLVFILLWFPAAGAAVGAIAVDRLAGDRHPVALLPRAVTTTTVAAGSRGAPAPVRRAVAVVAEPARGTPDSAPAGGPASSTTVTGTGSVPQRRSPAGPGPATTTTARPPAATTTTHPAPAVEVPPPAAPPASTTTSILTPTTAPATTVPDPG